MSQHHVLIIGAGITGLVLAQALNRHRVPFTIFERDPHPYHRGKGWGLTIHWSLNTLLSLLPDHLIARLPETYVDPQAVRKGENGNFLFFNLQTGEALWKVPPNKRIRVSREKLRLLLMEGLDIKWTHTFTSMDVTRIGEVVAKFTTADGGSQTFKGSFLVGCDGARSRVRASLLPHSHINYVLPVRLLGVGVVYPASLASKARDLDPFFYQAGDPQTDVFHWFSFLDSPSSNDRAEKDSYDCQILVSWPYRPSFYGHSAPLEVPTSNEERMQLMKALASGWSEPFREIVEAIPNDIEVKTISLEDWDPSQANWSNMKSTIGGKAALVGDAAHAMVMFRGDGANHGIMDIAVLLEHLLPALKSGMNDPAAVEFASARYVQEMVSRTSPAVLNSRQACLDANQYSSINDDSPLITRRVVREK